MLPCLDPASAYGMAVALPSKASFHTTSAIDAMLALLPTTPRVVRSDNGSEFEARFAQQLAQRGIARWYSYPKTPKMNAHAERFNRTVQGSFEDYHEELLLFTDLALFNQKLSDWIVFHNAQSPHHRLGQKPPLTYFFEHQPQCHRWWTLTGYRQRTERAVSFQYSAKA